MSYQAAMEAAGAKVLAFESFGSYQGEWFALVEVGGKRGWVSGSYGSCSGCDAFEAEVGDLDEWCDEHAYKAVGGCRDCANAIEQAQVKLAEFGRGYLDRLLTQEEAEKDASANLEWDMDAEPMLAFVKAHADAAQEPLR